MSTTTLDRLARVASPKAIVPAAWITALVARRRDGAARVALGTSVAVATADVLKRLVHRRRPGLFDAAPRESFPSGHSAASTAYLLGVALLAPPAARPPALIAAWVGAVTVNALRVAARQHWPGDVIAGDALGVAGLATAHLVLSRARRNGRRPA